MNEPLSVQKFRNENQSLVNGYIRPISNSEVDEYITILTNCSLKDKYNPFAITAFGDIIAIDNEGFIMIFRLVDGIENVICADADLFFNLLDDKEYLNDCFFMDDYEYARKVVGELQKDESYIYEPIPALGGSKSRESIGKGKTKEYLVLLNSFI